MKGSDLHVAGPGHRFAFGAAAAASLKFEIVDKVDWRGDKAGDVADIGRGDLLLRRSDRYGDHRGEVRQERVLPRCRP